MAKKDKKYATEQPVENVVNEDGEVVATLNPNELAIPDQPAEAKEPRAPRIVRPRYVLVNTHGDEYKFTHYALPTRRAAAGKIMIDGIETEFIVTKSQSRDKTEDRAYSYFKLPNGATGYVSCELANAVEFKCEERAAPPAFGKAPKEATGDGTFDAMLPRAEMPSEA